MRRALTLAAVAAVTAVACRTWRPIETDDDFRRADQACAADDQVACGYLADSLREARRYERAWKLALASCDAGAAIGCASLGWFFMGGEGEVKKDTPRALAYLDDACDRGVVGACVDVAVILLERYEHTAPRLARAAQVSERACDAGHLMGCTNFGYLLEEEWVGHLDPVRARALFLWGCDAGSTPSCRRAGLNLLEDAGGPADVDGGYALLEAACLRRDARACLALGNRDEDVRKTVPRALRFYRRACHADDRYGCVGLAANLHIVDAGLDAWEALDSSEIACERGKASGCALLSDYLLRPEFEPDAPRARMLAENSCDAGERHGCAIRARFEDGGLPWLRRAVELGSAASLRPYLLLLEGAERRAEADRLCDAGRLGACGLPDGGSW